MPPVRDDRAPRPLVILAVIGLCVAVFLWRRLLPPDEGQMVVIGYGLIPAVLFGGARLIPELRAVPAPLGLVTATFLHAGVLHLAANMVYLRLFGGAIEAALGHRRFALLYFVGGAAAGLAYAAVEPGSTVPMIGASGAVSAVLGAYLVLYPRTSAYALPFGRRPVAVRAGWLLASWFVLQLVNVLGPPGGVAWTAHVGGFLAGMALVVPLRDKTVPLFGARPPRRG